MAAIIPPLHQGSSQKKCLTAFQFFPQLALSQVKGRPKEMMLGFCEGLAEVMFKFTGIVMLYAPVGIGTPSGERNDPTHRP